MSKPDELECCSSTPSGRFADRRCCHRAIRFAGGFGEEDDGNFFGHHSESRLIADKTQCAQPTRPPRPLASRPELRCPTNWFFLSHLTLASKAGRREPETIFVRNLLHQNRAATPRAKPGLLRAGLGSFFQVFYGVVALRIAQIG